MLRKRLMKKCLVFSFLLLFTWSGFCDEVDSDFTALPVNFKQSPITIKDVSIAPKEIPNDGTGRFEVKCTVFTANEQAVIKSVWIDMFHTFLFAGQPLKPVCF